MKRRRRDGKKFIILFGFIYPLPFSDWIYQVCIIWIKFCFIYLTFVFRLIFASFGRYMSNTRTAYISPTLAYGSSFSMKLLLYELETVDVFSLINFSLNFLHKHGLTQIHEHEIPNRIPSLCDEWESEWKWKDEWRKWKSIWIYGQLPYARPLQHKTINLHKYGNMIIIIRGGLLAKKYYKMEWVWDYISTSAISLLFFFSLIIMYRRLALIKII